jgi:hypothetical protein
MESSHGNSEKENGPYKRTHPDVLQDAAEELNTKNLRQVYKEMVLKDEANAQRDLQQLRDLKYRIEGKSATSRGNNVADDILNVLSMVRDHPFIQKVDQSRNNVPSIILFSYEQMTDFQTFIGTSKKKRVVIDSTFNLGNVYVTSFVYKNERVIRKDSSDHSAFLGSVFLHKEATFHNYHYFLSHISAKLASLISDIDVILPTQIEVGSDDENALTEAIDVVFPNSKLSLCTKHLKDNITDYLKNKIGINTKDRIHLIDLIFGEQGILNSADTFQFEEWCSQLLTNANTPDFNNYFERTLHPKLELNYKNLGRAGLNAANRWTNNNAESINNIMKLDAN